MDLGGQECGYCGDAAVYNAEAMRWEHATDGDRVRVGGPGDLVSARHNRAGTQVLTVDLVDAEEEVDTTGWVASGSVDEVRLREVLQASVDRARAARGL